MKSDQQTRHRRLLAALTLAVGVVSGALPPIGSAARAQELLWATQAGADNSNMSSDEGLGIATTERGGYSYVTGFFRGTATFGEATFGEGEPNETTLTSAGNDDIFVAKYDRDGALLWATSAGSAGRDYGVDIATTENGDSYVTGFFSGTATFGQDEPNETTLTSTRGEVIFVAKYDRDGALLWVTSANGYGPSNGIATTPRGDSYVTGHFHGTTTFGQGEPNQTTLTAAGERDIFVAKYDRDGALLWATQVHDAGDDFGLGISATERGDSYVTGYFLGTATFGQGEPNQTTLNAAGSADIYVAKYDRDGALLWATRAGSAGSAGTDYGFAIATTERGDSYVTGLFSGTATFGHDEPNETTLIDAGGTDIFVAKYDRDGALLWATRAGGANSDAAFAIASTHDGESSVAGRFRGAATFGQDEPNETTLTSPGDTDFDIFVAKYR
jgi:hypothetical protein